MPWKHFSPFLLSSHRAVGFLEIRRRFEGPQLAAPFQPLILRKVYALTEECFDGF